LSDARDAARARAEMNLEPVRKLYVWDTDTGARTGGSC
jgi:hypothetical protein